MTSRSRCTYEKLRKDQKIFEISDGPYFAQKFTFVRIYEFCNGTVLYVALKKIHANLIIKQPLLLEFESTKLIIDKDACMYISVHLYTYI